MTGMDQYVATVRARLSRPLTDTESGRLTDLLVPFHGSTVRWNRDRPTLEVELSVPSTSVESATLTAGEAMRAAVQAIGVGYLATESAMVREENAGEIAAAAEAG